MVREFVVLVDVIVGVVVLGGLEELEFGVGMRLAGVEINHLIKRKSIGVFAGVIVGSGEPVRKELKIRWRGCRRFEQTAIINICEYRCLEIRDSICAFWDHWASSRVVGGFETSHAPD